MPPSPVGFLSAVPALHPASKLSKTNEPNKDKAGLGIIDHADSRADPNKAVSESAVLLSPPLPLSSQYIDLNVDSAADRSRLPITLTKRQPQRQGERPRTCSPDDFRRSTSSSHSNSASRRLNIVPEEDPAMDEHQQQQQVEGAGQVGPRYYGAIGGGHAEAPRYLGGAPLDDEESELDEDEEQWLLDEELAREGLYQGNYKNLILLYTLVPLSTVLTFLILALLPTLFFPSHTPSLFPYPPYLPFPIPEVLTATALWSLAYLLRDVLYATALALTSLLPFQTRLPRFIPVLTSLFAALLQTTSTLLFRQLAVPILLIPYYTTQPFAHQYQVGEELKRHHYPTWQDDAFRRVWWVALGWAAAEAVVGVKQGYESISLYRDVLVTVKRSAGSKTEMGEGPLGRGRSPHLGDASASKTRGVQEEADDLNATPTQRNWEGRRRALGAPDLSYGYHTRPVSQSPSAPLRRTLSDSLSSLSDSVSGLPIDISASATLGIGERQPLLPTLRRTETRETRESERVEVENEVERDLERLMALKSREEMEEVYGIPVIRIPVFISCLHRINTILSSLGVTLLLSAAYMQSPLAVSPPPPPPPPPSFFSPSFPPSPSPSFLPPSSLPPPPSTPTQTPPQTPHSC
ncbi:hypothetical protein B0H34DRAFT_78984 [Crassisporium funariophilum]|nr:hypothetical protein B0H34DRAFT_78984 [Crassisporium funariophilum]